MNNPPPYKDPGAASIIELLCGFAFGMLGAGRIYAGDVYNGILLMISYWVLMFFVVVLYVGVVILTIGIGLVAVCLLPFLHWGAVILSTIAVYRYTLEYNALNNTSRGIVQSGGAGLKSWQLVSLVLLSMIALLVFSCLGGIVALDKANNGPSLSQTLEQRLPLPTFSAPKIELPQSFTLPTMEPPARPTPTATSVIPPMVIESALIGYDLSDYDSVVAQITMRNNTSDIQTVHAEDITLIVNRTEQFSYDWQSHNTIIANIPPRETVRVRIRYRIPPEANTDIISLQYKDYPPFEMPPLLKQW